MSVADWEPGATHLSAEQIAEIKRRLGVAEEKTSYEDVRSWFDQANP